MRLAIFLCFCSCLLCLTGCFQVNSDDDLRTVPITNNPQLIPGSSGGLPGMPFGGPSAGPR